MDTNKYKYFLIQYKDNIHNKEMKQLEESRYRLCLFCKIKSLASFYQIAGIFELYDSYDVI